MKTIKINKLVCGVGINDADYSVSPRNGKQRKTCVFYRKWKQMIERCYSQRELKKYPSYAGCSVCNEWLTFSNFRNWMKTKKFENKQLDKDLKVLNNKLYSPNTCMFVSNKINTLLCDAKAIRGKFPLGVFYCNTKGKYISKISINGNCKKLGSHATVKSAEISYLTAKHQYVCQFANDEPDKEVSQALHMQAGLIFKKLQLVGAVKP